MKYWTSSLWFDGRSTSEGIKFLPHLKQFCVKWGVFISKACNLAPKKHEFYHHLDNWRLRIARNANRRLRNTAIVYWPDAAFLQMFCFIRCPILYNSPPTLEFTSRQLVGRALAFSYLVQKGLYFLFLISKFGIISIIRKLACGRSFQVNLSHEICDWLKVWRGERLSCPTISWTLVHSLIIPDTRPYSYMLV